MAYPSLFDLIAVAMYLGTPSLLALICILNNGVCFSRLRSLRDPCAAVLDGKLDFSSVGRNVGLTKLGRQPAD